MPAPLTELRRETPPMLSAIVARLLEKEPDRRYQSAEGLAHDLARLREGPGEFPLGERDFPPRLTAPSILVGRGAEVITLRAAWEEAVLGGGRGILISGPPGVGKTALINALRRPVATRRRLVRQRAGRPGPAGRHGRTGAAGTAPARPAAAGRVARGADRPAGLDDRRSRPPTRV